MMRWTNGLPGATTRLGAKMALRGLAASQPGCARIPMMVRSKRCSTKRPDTLMQLSRSSLSEIRLAPRGRAIHSGTKPKSTHVGCYVRFSNRASGSSTFRLSTSAVSIHFKPPLNHSITSSARASSVGGSSNPIDLAVLRLAPGHVRYGCGRDDARTTGTAPHNCADRQRAVALALPQREKLGVDDVIGLDISAGAESGRAAYPRSRL
jgi:hypothetical protein